MAYNNLTFKKLDNGYYETFFKGKSTRIFFKIPDGFKIEDYPINTYGPCAKIENDLAYFELTKEPKDTFTIEIATDAGLYFEKAFPIKIGSKLILGANTDMTIKTNGGPDIYFDALRIEKNKKGSITFVSNKLKRLSQKELKDEKLNIEETAITSNNNMKLFVNNNCSIKSIDNLFTPDRFKNKLDLSKVRYIDIERSCFYPEQNFNSFSVASDLFILRTSNISLTKMNEENAKSSSIEMANTKRGLSRIEIGNSDISLFDGSVVRVNAEKLEFGDPKERAAVRFHGENQLNAKEKIVITGADNLTDTNISSENQGLHIHGSGFLNATINFTRNSEENSVSKITYVTITNSILDNISGNLLRSNIHWAKANNIVLGEESCFDHNAIQNSLPAQDYLLNLNNITIAPDSSVNFGFGENLIRSLNNCYFEGEITIESDCPYTINSSIIKNSGNEESTISINSNNGTPLLENVILNGGVEIKNVDELSYSEISNSKLLSPYRVNASNLFLCDETITNFDSDNIEHKVDSTVTNELDIL